MEKQKLKNVLLGLLLFYGFLCLLLRWLYPFILFQPTTLAASYIFNFKNSFEELDFTPEKAVKLNALWFKSVSPKRVVLFLHGNRDNLVRWGEEYSERFLKNGYDVLMYDYRGYGKSTGKRSEAALHADAQYVYDFLKKQYPENKITIYGYSLGTGMATQLAANNQPKQLVLEAAYVSIPAVVRSYLPLFPYEQLFQYTFHNDSCLAQVRCAVHLFHGTDDQVVPYKNSQILAEIPNLNQIKPTLTTILNGQHRHLDTSLVYQNDLKKILFIDK